MKHSFVRPIRVECCIETTQSRIIVANSNNVSVFVRFCEMEVELSSETQVLTGGTLSNIL